ncbi:hypothetical protein RFI_32796, partial [Reticulomyxa filosa]
VPFKDVKNLPIPLAVSQCVSHKYPNDVQLVGHCVVKLVDNKNDKDSNEITLLSFGGHYNHTLVMKYVSVWSDIPNKSNELSNYNEWVPLTDNHNNPIMIEGDDSYYTGVRAVVGGSNNHLLFITYLKNNISVFNLNTFEFIKHDTLPTDNSIFYHCFVSKPENGQVQEMVKTNQKNKQNCEMLLFCKKTGLSIEYDEDKNKFQFHKLLVSKDIELFFAYAYVCINDVILFFGGQNGKFGPNKMVSKSVHKYFIRENKWMMCESTLPSLLYSSVGILSEDNTYIHIVGGFNEHGFFSPRHIKTHLSEWLNEGEMRKKGQLKVEKEEKEEKKEENDKQDVSVTFLLYLYLMTNYK